MITKRMKRLLTASAFVSLIIGPYSYADFSFYWRDNNYFLTEHRMFNTLDLDRENSVDNTGNTRNFWTLKFRMKPSLSVTDRLTFHSTFDAFVNPFAHAQEGGALQGTQTPDTLSYGPTVSPTLPRSLFGSVSGFGRSAVTLTNNFLVKVAYLEYISDWGVLKLGRIPRHWGLGVRYNAGDKPEDKFNDRTDSVFYELSLGNFKLAGIYSKVLENNIDKESDDVTLWEAYSHYNHPEKDINFGMLYTYMRHGRNSVRLHTADVYMTKKFKKLFVGAEGVYLFGTPGRLSGNSAQAIGVAGEVSYNWSSKFNAYVKAGYASGADLSQLSRLTLFPFHRNYDIALIMFNQGVGGIPAQTGVSAASPPDANTIHNAFYGNVGANYHYNDRLGVNLNYAIAQTERAVTPSGNNYYGQEADLILWYQFLPNLKFTGGGGAFFPGNFFQGTPVMSVARSTDYSYGAYVSSILTF